MAYPMNFSQLTEAFPFNLIAPQKQESWQSPQQHLQQVRLEIYISGPWILRRKINQ